MLALVLEMGPAEMAPADDADAEPDKGLKGALGHVVLWHQ